MSLTDMALASNEAREQRIMKLRRDFNNKKYITVQSVVNGTGYVYNTVLKWAIDGNIPLLGNDGKPVVPLTEENTPRWLKR